MSIQNGTILKPYLEITDKPGGGSIGTAANTVDKYDAFVLKQTTAGQALTVEPITALLNNPKLIASISFLNRGTVPVTILGQKLEVNQSVSFSFGNNVYSVNSINIEKELWTVINSNYTIVKKGNYRIADTVSSPIAITIDETKLAIGEDITIADPNRRLSDTVTSTLGDNTYTFTDSNGVQTPNISFVMRASGSLKTFIKSANKEYRVLPRVATATSLTANVLLKGSLDSTTPSNFFAIPTNRIDSAGNKLLYVASTDVTLDIDGASVLIRQGQTIQWVDATTYDLSEVTAAATQAEVTAGTALAGKYVQPDTLKVELDKKENLIDATNFENVGSEKALGINKNDNTAQKVFDKLNSFEATAKSDITDIRTGTDDNKYTTPKDVHDYVKEEEVRFLDKISFRLRGYGSSAGSVINNIVLYDIDGTAYANTDWKITTPAHASKTLLSNFHTGPNGLVTLDIIYVGETTTNGLSKATHGGNLGRIENITAHYLNGVIAYSYTNNSTAPLERVLPIPQQFISLVKPTQATDISETTEKEWVDPKQVHEIVKSHVDDATKWQPNRLYTVDNIVTFSTTLSNAQDVDGNVLTPNKTYLAKYRQRAGTGEISSGTLDATEIAKLEVLGGTNSATTTTTVPNSYIEPVASTGANDTTNTHKYIQIPSGSDVETMSVNFRDRRTVYDNGVRDTGVQTFTKSELLTGKAGWTFSQNVTIGGQTYTRNERVFSMDSTTYKYYINVRFAAGGMYVIFQDNHHNNPGPVNLYGGYEGLTVTFNGVTTATGLTATNPTDADVNKIAYNNGNNTVTFKSLPAIANNPNDTDTTKFLSNDGTGKKGVWKDLPKGLRGTPVTTTAELKAIVAQDFELRLFGGTEYIFKLGASGIVGGIADNAGTGLWVPQLNSNFTRATTTIDQGVTWNTGIDDYIFRVQNGQLQMNKGSILDNVYGIESYTDSTGIGNKDTTIPRRVSFAGNPNVFFNIWKDSTLNVPVLGTEWYEFTEETTGKSYIIYFRPVNSSYTNNILTFTKK